jgi:DNA (cytosine-5)-methyltransferase 1
MLTAIDLFAGAGGLSRGLEEAGIEVVAAAEWDEDALATFALQHPRAALFSGDVAAVDFRSLRGSVDVVAGGPPCQPWSEGGKQLGHADPRDGLPKFVAAVREIKPAAFVFENVPGLARGSMRRAFEFLVQSLREEGFEVTWRILSAADYGIPQRRQRIFMVGTRMGRFGWPDPTHGLVAGLPLPSAGEYIDPAIPRGVPNLSKVVYAKNPDLRPRPYDGHLFNGGGRPIDLNAPAPTMLASMGGNKTPWVDVLGIVPGYHDHLVAGGQPRSGLVSGARRITVTEAAILQTFPADTVFVGRPSSQYRQVGNAVPPLLARAVGRAVATALSPATKLVLI